MHGCLVERARAIPVWWTIGKFARGREWRWLKNTFAVSQVQVDHENQNQQSHRTDDRREIPKFPKVKVVEDTNVAVVGNPSQLSKTLGRN